MPGHLSEASKSYNQIKRIHHDDPIHKLEYYLANDSLSVPSQNDINLNATPHSRSRLRASGASTRSPQDISSSSAASSVLTTTAAGRGQRSSQSSSSSALSYSSKLINLMKSRGRHGIIGALVTSGDSDGSHSLDNKRVRQQCGLQTVDGHQGRTPNRNSKNASPLESSGFSEGTLIGPTMSHCGQASEMALGRRNPQRATTRRPYISADSNAPGESKELDEDVDDYDEYNQALGSGRATPPIINNHGKQVRIMPPPQPQAIRNNRTKRRKVTRMNRRMMPRGADGEQAANPYDNFSSNPYALSELFSQSEIPGFREIFASDSYLRKFCWIVAFVSMTVWSLRDASELITEYYEYPITVDVRLKDSARLPFPAVTVCNLNVVRSSALCSNSHFEVGNSMPSEMRDKLCGIQVEKKKNESTSDADISDINNIGISTTTTITTTTTMTTTVSPTATTGTQGSALNILPGATTSAKPMVASSTTLFSTTPKQQNHETSVNNHHRPHQLPDDPRSTAVPFLTTSPPNGGDGNDGADGDSDDSPLENHRLAAKAQHLRTQRRKSNNHHTRSSYPFALLSATNLLTDENVRIKRSHRLDSGADRPFASSKWQVRVASSISRSTNPHQNDATKASQLHGQFKLNNVVDHHHHQQNKQFPVSSGVGNRQPGGNQQQQHMPAQPGPSQQPPVVVGNKNNQNTNFNPVPPAPSEEFELTERQERELQENLTNWLAVMYQRDQHMTRSLGHQFDDMILRCTMKSINCTRQRSFDTSFTPTEGNCFTFKSRVKRKVSANQMTIQWDTYEEANLAGTNDGLELVLNLEKNEYISGSSQVGALVMIHHPSEQGYAASEATFIAPEFTTYIGLKMTNITRQPYPFPERCVDTWPTKFADTLTKNKTYSQQACLKICLQKAIQTHCNCQSAFLPIIEPDSEQLQQQQEQQQKHQQQQEEMSKTTTSVTTTSMSPLDSTPSPLDFIGSSPLTRRTGTNPSFRLGQLARSKKLLGRSSHISPFTSSLGGGGLGEAALSSKDAPQQQQQRIIICDTRKRATRQCVREINLRAADRVKECDCPAKCRVIRYDKTISTARWPTREDRVSFDRGKMDLNFQNLAKVIVYFQTMTCEEVHQQPMINAAKLFSSLGGVMGMYIGFSFLSVFEMVEVMSRKFWHHITVKYGSRFV